MRGLLVPQTLAVVGANFPNKGKAPTRRFEIAVCKPGDTVELRPEPKNPADERAIAVYSERDVQLGYLRAEHAWRMGKLMEAGHAINAIFQEATSYGAAIRVAFDDDLPVLPEPKKLPVADPHDERFTVDPDPDWYPDEIWPDE